MAFFELRQYKIRPGKMAQWLDFMENEIIPFQVSKGAVICGSFQGEEDDSVYFWIRRFESCLLYTSPSPRDVEESRMPSSA